jgi:hypothetical protein
VHVNAIFAPKTQVCTQNFTPKIENP